MSSDSTSDTECLDSLEESEEDLTTQEVDPRLSESERLVEQSLRKAESLYRELTAILWLTQKLNISIQKETALTSLQSRELLGPLQGSIRQVQTAYSRLYRELESIIGKAEKSGLKRSESKDIYDGALQLTKLQEK